MANVWTVRLEDGTWTTEGCSLSGSADITVTAGAALAGTVNGLNVVVDETTANYIYPTASSQTGGRARWRFYFDPNSIPMDNNEEILLFFLRFSTSSLSVALVYLYYSSTYGYQIYCGAVNDVPAAVNTATYTLPATNDGPHYIECDLIRAATSSSSDGSIQLWIDGVSKETITGIDNFHQMATYNSFRFGKVLAGGTPGSGTIFLDELILNNDGTAIGVLLDPLAINVAGDNSAYYHYGVKVKG